MFPCYINKLFLHSFSVSLNCVIWKSWIFTIITLRIPCRSLSRRWHHWLALELPAAYLPYHKGIRLLLSYIIYCLPYWLWLFNLVPWIHLVVAIWHVYLVTSSNNIYVKQKYNFIFYSLDSFHQLKSLELSFNDFSAGLPDVISEMTSLEELSLWKCSLTDLPERYVVYASSCVWNNDLY